MPARIGSQLRDSMSPRQSVDEGGVSTPCGAVSTRGIIVFVPRLTPYRIVGRRKSSATRGAVAVPQVIYAMKYLVLAVCLMSSVIRLSLGKLWINLSQVVKRTNTPLIPKKMASSTDHVFFGSWVQIPPSTINKLFQTFPMSNLRNTLPGYTQEMKPLGY